MALPGIPAIYRNEEYPDYRGNPLIEALPALPDHVGALNALFHQPERPAEFQSLPLHHRLEALETLQELFIPLDYHAAAMMRVFQLIRWSYARRNPNDPKVMQRVYQLAALEQSRAALTRGSMGGGGAIGIAGIGITGAGKTSWGDRFLEFLPQYPLIHEEIGGKRCRVPQIPIIRVQCPPTGSLHDFAQSVLLAIDSVLGTKYFVGSKSLSKYDLLLRMVSACSSYFVGALLVDDAQNLRESKSEAKKLLAFFANFMEMTGIPVIIFGTYRLQRVLDRSEAHTGKLTAKGIIEFSRLGKDSTELRKLCLALWEMSVSSVHRPMPGDFPKMVYFHTLGVPRIIRKLIFHLHQRNAEHGCADASEDLLDAIAAKELREYQPALAELRRHDSGAPPPREDQPGYEDFLPLETSTASLRQERERTEATKTQVKAGTRGAKKKSGAGVITSPKPSGRKERAELDELSDCDDPYHAVRSRGWFGESLLKLA